MTGRTRHLGKKDRPRGVTTRSAGARKRAKSAGVVKCTDCRLVEHRGRWTERAPALAAMTGGLCPACQRIRERHPAETLRVPLGRIDSHRRSDSGSAMSRRSSGASIRSSA